MKVFEIKQYLTETGECPFRDWLEHLNIAIRARIQERIFRLELGNLGDYKFLGSGIYEIRCDFGPGYRIYFSIEGRKVILLLVGGDKKTQRRDIAIAKSYWLNWKKGSSYDKKKP